MDLRTSSLRQKFDDKRINGEIFPINKQWKKDKENDKLKNE